MLSDQQRAIVKATVPALHAHGETITRHFYSAMLTAHPELHNYFNPTNQLGEGGQARALAASVLTYAQHIDGLETLGGMVERIATKHVSLEILPEHYPIVGKYLLLAIADVLEDAATPDILDAWAAAYGQLARTHLPAGNAEFYYCGPIGFMAAAERVLNELGVPAQRRHSEAFAPDEFFGVGRADARCSR